MEYRKLGRTGVSIPAVGMGTWAMGGHMGPDENRDNEAVEALQFGLDLGMTLIDTAEMYGGGHSEGLVAQAVLGRREQAFLATKVSPQHFSYDNVLKSARRSLERLRATQVDLYQLHWPNPRVPIKETMRAMEKLVHDGFVRYVGVSNFSEEQLVEAESALSRERIVSNQVEYSLVQRSPEDDILAYCEKEDITLIAYSPLGQGRIPRGRGAEYDVLDEVAKRLGKTRGQVALNWLLRNKQVVVIPKAANKKHVRENAEVSDWKLGDEDFRKLSLAFKRDS